jgi:hypothetical protein
MEQKFLDWYEANKPRFYTGQFDDIQIAYAAWLAGRDSVNSQIAVILRMAAENIGFVETTSEELNSDEYKPFITANDGTIWTINKQSITNIIEQIK